MFVKMVDGSDQTFDVSAWRSPEGAGAEYDSVGEVVDDVTLTMERAVALLFGADDEMTVVPVAAITSIVVQAYDPSAPTAFFV